MLHSTLPARLLFLVSVFCVAALAIALYSQHYLGMRPCAWCVFQRLILLLLALSAGIGGLILLTSPQHLLGRLLAALSAILSLGGILSAWYQYSVAAQQFSCDMTFADQVMTQSGLESAVPWLFGIYATCMDARVELLGLEYALWGMGLFTITLALSAYAALRK
ncbi:disulfide bond formation protein B [Alcaligenes endophyticus]|uniref:Disulfide bond formation protein B n=1 Tax=Alcaligenes endophyticus TaxID=1929088 RepID=A0ABT8EJJ9_9BURK|nr:disulfide bond formation protein B [Alcaligenes endophyticus]MCX5591690.1 disulfide bond formation protein B [Alcaligenes endophyticus]MDN4121367.1 disulfide bond formation protein B [Alcaligenes endophyticus]